MDVTQLSQASRAKPLSIVAKDLDLSPRFAAPDQHSLTIALLAKHVDQMRLEIELLRIEMRRRWWHRFTKRSQR